MKLKQLKVTDFAAINNSAPVVFDFTQSKFVKLKGDEGLSKTNLINSLLMACGMLGAPDSKENKKFINDDTGKLELDMDFTGTDKYDYSVRCTKSVFSLTYAGENIPEPLTKIKQLLGVVGISPMEIKTKPLKEIVKWLSSYSNKSAEEFEAQMDKFKISIKSARESRAMANKSAKALNEFLVNEDLYINWEESEVKFAKDVDLKELSGKLDAAGKKSDKYIQSEGKVRAQIDRKEVLVKQIADLQKELLTVGENIAIGTEWLEKNKTVKKDYDDIRKEYDNAAAKSIQYNKWQEVKRKAKDKDEYETLSQRSDAQEKELLQRVKELQAEIIPDLKGLELVMEDTHEDGVMKKEGLYFEGKSVTKLSESQWWSVVLSIWRKYKVKTVVIDNYQSLGSGAVAILEKLANDGAYILVAEMDRKKKSLEIIYE